MDIMLLDNTNKTEGKMKKNCLLFTLVAICLFGLISCTSMAALGGAMETMYTPYELANKSDIYGQHVTTAVLVDRQTEGLASCYFTTRIVKNTLDGKLENYGLLFRQQLNMGYDSYYRMWQDPVIKVDGKVYKPKTTLIPDLDTVSVGSMHINEREAVLSNECVTALKNAKSVFVQFYTVNGKDKVVQIGAEGLQAIKDFLK